MTANDDKKRGTDKIGGIESSKKAQEVKRAESVAEVEAVKSATAIGNVNAAGGIDQRRKATRIMSAEEREKLLKMVDDEADKLFKTGAIPGTKKDLITKAVKMAVDSSIVLEDDVSENTDKTK